jgi:hydroxysqualene dehydroxylase
VARRIAVVGGGWAGISAAVAATSAGEHVTLFEMAAQLGGRARQVEHSPELALDNGQHILIGAYRETLSLMRCVGAEPDQLLLRRSLALVDPAGQGLRLKPGPPALAFAVAVLGRHGWSAGERVGLLAAALRWRLNGFRAQPEATVAELTRKLSPRILSELIEPLCVAALNTPASQASASVFLRVLRDALFNGPGSADLLLPRVSLSELLPAPAARWLAHAGAELRYGSRAMALAPHSRGWRLDGESFDAVVLACTAQEAARLCQAHAPRWAALAQGFDYEPIITVYLRSRGTRLAEPMTTLAGGDGAPAQFAFDLGAIDGGGPRDGVFAFVVSGARQWVERGLDACTTATLAQAHDAFGAAWREPPTVLRALAERRATFLCRPALGRPPVGVLPGLAAAGDYTEGPYPATLEGAVRSGAAAVRWLSEGKVQHTPRRPPDA